MPHRWRSGAMGCGVRHAVCGLCALRAAWRGVRCAPAARERRRGAQRGRAETACLLTAASPSAWSASPPASSASPTSRNAPCSQETSIVWLFNQGRPSGRSFLLPLRALRPSAIYARLLKKRERSEPNKPCARRRTPYWGKEKIQT